MNAPLDTTVSSLREALTQAGFGVLFEADIGANLERYAERHGEQGSGIAGIRSLTFCSPPDALKVAREMPKGLALCPLRVTVAHDGATSSILFVRPTMILDGLEEVEAKVLAAIEVAATRA